MIWGRFYHGFLPSLSPTPWCFILTKRASEDLETIRRPRWHRCRWYPKTSVFLTGGWRVTCVGDVFREFSLRSFIPIKNQHTKNKKTSSRVMVFMLLSSWHPWATPDELYIFQLVFLRWYAPKAIFAEAPKNLSGPDFPVQSCESHGIHWGGKGWPGRNLSKSLPLKTLEINKHLTRPCKKTWHIELIKWFFFCTGWLIPNHDQWELVKSHHVSPVLLSKKKHSSLAKFLMRPSIQHTLDLGHDDIATGHGCQPELETERAIQQNQRWWR